MTTTLVAAMVLIAAAAAGAGHTNPTHLEAARRHAPQFEVALVDGVGHFLMLEAPERFGTLLIDALGRMSGPDRKRH